MERAILDKLLDQDFPGAKELREQASCAMILDDSVPGVVVFHVPEGPSAPVNQRVPVAGCFKSGQGLDEDDLYTVEALLHVVDGRLNELEIVAPDPYTEFTQCDPARLYVYVRPPLNKR